MTYDINYFNDLITNSSSYFAHLSQKLDTTRKPELLSEHSALTYAYARMIEEKQSLNGLIEKLIFDAVPSNVEHKKLLSEKIKQLFWRAIAFHDLGKVNKGFQRSKMGNSANLLEVKHTFNEQHSVISMYIYLADFFSDFLHLDFSDEEQILLSNIALYMSYPIYKHHNSVIDNAQDSMCWDNEELFALKPFLTLFKIPLKEEQIDSFHNCFLKNANFNFLFDRFNDLQKNTNPFPLFALIKLNYSLLTTCDYLATAHYKNDWQSMLSDFGLIDNVLKNKIITNVETFEYNKAVFEAIYKEEFLEPDMYRSQSKANLNTLRKSIAKEVVTNIRENSDKTLFYIEAPTGSGKTNISMLALAELLRNDTENSISKVFYVFPFTTLITQTYKSLLNTLGLDDSEIAEIHSKAPFQIRNDQDDYLNYLDNLFMNYPITLMSHIRFFDVLKTDHKESNYLLHRMVNSLVIIDEIQSYSPKIWDKIIYFIVNYAKYFNIKFIIMSATLPKIGDIIDNKELASDFVYLINNKNKYFQNPNFCNRVEFNYDLLSLPIPEKEEKDAYLQNLKQTVIEKSEEYSKSNFLNPDSVFTIVEFIFKKTASEFYSLLIEDNVFFDEIYLLSGTVLEPRRKEIINKLKSEEIRVKKILLISTQVIEAGVDIDMDIGFKDKSIIDSEEQLAGRINRNASKQKCILYIFDCDSEKMLYDGDARYRLTKTEFKNSEYQKILETKDFDKLYDLIIKQIKEKSKSIFISNLTDQIVNNISTLNFKAVNKGLNIIETSSISVFVPLLIEIKYLTPFIDAIDEFCIPYNKMICGADIWNCYELLIKNQDEDFVKSKTKMKKLQGLMSNFVFSIFPKGRDSRDLKTYGHEEYGFLYLENYDDVFSLENGINTSVLKESNFI